MNTRVLPVLPMLTVLLALPLLEPFPIEAATGAVSDCGDDGGPNQLRQVIAAAGAGDTINIVACTIALSTPANPLTINKNLTINGAGAGQTIIDGGDVTGILLISGASPSVTVTGVTLQHGNGAGLSPFAGAVRLANGSSLTLSSSAVSANRGVNGGGVLADNLTTLTVIDSVVSGNESACTGGVHNQGTLIMVRSTVSGNRSTGSCNAGGIAAFGPTTLINTTLSGNDGGSETGGISVTNGTTLTVTSSTITGNTGHRAVAIDIGTTVTMSSTIVANNSGTNCAGAAITSAGHNLDSGNTCDFTTVGDLVNTDPQLLPLANYGGATPTHALLPTSPAIGAGDDASCPATDQRGLARVGTCDIGAFEAQGTPVLLSANDVSYSAGDTLTLDALVQNPVGVPVTVDAYLVFFLPAGSLPSCPAVPLAFVTSAGTLATACGATDSPASFSKLASGVTIPAGFVGSQTLFTATTPALTTPMTATLALTPAGALDDGSFDPGDIAASSDVTFSLHP